MKGQLTIDKNLFMRPLRYGTGAGNLLEDEKRARLATNRVVVDGHGMKTE